MKIPSLLHRPLAALVVGLLVTVFALPAATAADTATPPPAEKKAPSLPLTASFAKGTPGEFGGPYAVTLTNTSSKALKVSATIIQSVTSHNRPKTIELPAQEVAAAGTWVINDLAVDDRIVLSADGFEKLELKVPPGS